MRAAPLPESLQNARVVLFGDSNQAKKKKNKIIKMSLKF